MEPQEFQRHEFQPHESQPHDLGGGAAAPRNVAWLWATLKQQAVVAAVLCIWIPSVGFGLWTLLQYSLTPGRPASALPSFPAHAPIKLASGRATLVMFVHPQCPCSRASIGELALIMARAHEKVEATVVFYLPKTEPSAWAKTDLWQSAAIIPGVHSIEDPNGMTAQAFGAYTSGQTLLYNAVGHLVFSGGITASRGHSGDNAGRDAIVAWLLGDSPANNRTAVFGCSLVGEQ